MPLRKWPALTQRVFKDGTRPIAVNGGGAYPVTVSPAEKADVSPKFYVSGGKVWDGFWEQPHRPAA